MESRRPPRRADARALCAAALDGVRLEHHDVEMPFAVDDSSTLCRNDCAFCSCRGSHARQRVAGAPIAASAGRPEAGRPRAARPGAGRLSAGRPA